MNKILKLTPAQQRLVDFIGANLVMQVDLQKPIRVENSDLDMLTRSLRRLGLTKRILQAKILKLRMRER